MIYTSFLALILVENIAMSVASWLTGDSPKPGSKRKLAEIEIDSPSKRQFSKALNQASFDWYIKDANGLWYCRLCRECNVANSYATGHDKPGKTTNHSRHSSSKQHLNAVQRSTLSSHRPMQKLLVAKVAKDEDMAMNLLKTAYYIAKRELPKVEMKHIVDYAKFIGVNFGTSDSLSYTTSHSVSEFQSAISQVILEDSVSEIKKSDVFSITIDESTDRGNKKRLIIYAQCVNKSGLKYFLLSNKLISEGSANAINIVALLVEELKTKGLDISKMVGIGTDGASVMTGKNGGVVKLLKEHSPTLIGVHCAAHRTALATSQAAKLVPHMEGYARTIGSIFRYFHNSALRSNRLRAIQSLLNLPELKFAEVHSVRWLSLEHAVQVVYRTFPALCMTLEREATVEAAAKGLLQEVNQYKFIAITHLMMDILPFISRLSKTFQKETLDFSTVKPVVMSTCECLKDLIEVNGVFVDKLSKFVQVEDNQVIYTRPLSESDCKSVTEAIQNNVAFDGFSDSDESDSDDEPTNVGYSPELRYFTQQKELLSNIAPDYINKLTKNLENRFSETEMLESMKVFIPENICSAESTPKYGIQELEKLSTHFETHLPSKEEIKVEFQIYKRLVKGSYASASLLNVLSALMQSNDLPNMIMLLKCCVVIPMTSVQCERGFSTQNRIKSKSRTSMKCQTLDNLMRISEDGPELREFDFTRALAIWKAEKVRKLYNV